jgi:hypothetical protein
MNVKRYSVSLVVAFIAATVFDILLHGVILRESFEKGAEYWLPPDELNKLIPLGWGSMLVTMGCFGMLFVRGPWRGVRRGLQFGGWLALAAAAGVAGIASLVPWPGELLVGMGVQQAGNSLLLGCCFGWLYRAKDSKGS